jgi:tRNA threonylcarbamoyl adenosine modification protein YeaZ
MRTLAIDCATEACSVALFDDAKLLAGEYRHLARGHAEALVPMIAALPGRGKAERIVVALGPGSFTGLRVGLAAARALALAWQAELRGYPTLSLVAAMARSGRAVPVGVAMTAGHGEWFVQEFAADGTAMNEAAALAQAQAAKAVSSELVAGSQAAALVAIRGSGEAREIWPDARSYLLLPPEALTSDVSLRYGRAPDARLPGATP